MPMRVNPILLLSLILILVLSGGIWASAQLGINPIIGLGQQPVQPAGGSGDSAASLAEGKMGAPFALGLDGPNAFSCVGLMRYVLRENGTDPNAPWVPEEYLSRYAAVAPGDERRGDIAIFPGWATMLTGDGNVISANEAAGFVTKTPLGIAGVPLGIVRPPYPGAQTGDPLAPVTYSGAPADDPSAPVADSGAPTGDPSAPATDSGAPTDDPLLAPVTDTLGQVIDPLGQIIDPLAAGILPLASEDQYADPSLVSEDQYADPSLNQPVSGYPQQQQYY